MSVRLAKAVGSSAETWLGMQTDYDLAKLRNKGNVTMQRVACGAGGVRFGDAKKLEKNCHVKT